MHATRSLLLALALLVAAPAFAAEDEVIRTRVQSYLNGAGQLFQARDYEGALMELRRAEALTDLALVRFNIARCIEELGKPLEAIEAFEKYLAAFDESEGAAGRQQRAREGIARLERESLGVIEVSCPAVAGVTVEIPSLGEVPLACPARRGRVRPGVHRVRVVAPGRVPFVEELEVRAGQTAKVDATALAEASPEPPPGPVASPPETRPDPPEAAPATAAVLPDPAPEAPAAPVSVREPSRSSGRSTAGLVATCFGGASVVAAGVFGLMARGSQVSIEEEGGFDTAEDLEDEISRVGTLRTSSLVAASAGVVLVGAGLALLLTGDSPPPASTVLAPALLPGGAGLVFSGVLP